jgi:hypothetical protein
MRESGLRAIEEAMGGDMEREDLNGEASTMSVSVQLAPLFQPMAAASRAELLIDHCRENEG